MSGPEGQRPDCPIRWEFVTPQVAAGYLAKNVHNRNVRARRVGTLAGAIKRGEWRVNGDAICFDSKDRLQDGQHRLQAIIEADRGVWTLIVEGLPPSAQETKDAGAARTAADALALRGIENANQMAALAARLIVYEQSGGSVLDMTERFLRPTIHQIIAYTNRHRDEMYETVHRVNNWRGKNPHLVAMSPSLMMAISIVADRSNDGGTSAEFWDAIATANREDATPEAALARLFIKIKSETSKSLHTGRWIAAVTIKALNAWVLGEELRILRWKPKESFPTIIDTRDEALEVAR